MVSIPFLLWLGYHLVALPMACWACLGALLEDPGQGRVHRVATVVSAAALPFALVIAGLGGHGARVAMIALPLLSAAVVWSNLIALVSRGLVARLVHVPILFWNAALVAIYAARSVADLGADGGGTFGASLTGGHAMLQTWVGHPDAAIAAVWLHLPICIAAGPRPGWMHRVGLATSGLVAGTMSLLLLATMPGAIETVQLFRSPVGELTIPRADLQIGAPADFDRDPTTTTREVWNELGVDALTVDVDLELLQDHQRSSALRDQIAAVRKGGRHVIVVARPSESLERRPVGNVMELADVMAKVHWLAAERLEPDLLVLYAGPYGSLRRSCVQIGTIDEWRDACQRGAGDVRLANPRVQVALALESRAPHARELFRVLTTEPSPVHAVGLIARADDMPAAEALHVFDVFDSWFADHAVVRPVWLLEVGAAPASSGGDVGQWTFLARGLALANRRPQIIGLCIRAIDDRRFSRFGLRSQDGRPRLAYDELVELAATPPANTPR